MTAICQTNLTISHLKLSLKANTWTQSVSYSDPSPTLAESFSRETKSHINFILKTARKLVNPISQKISLFYCDQGAGIVPYILLLIFDTNCILLLKYFAIDFLLHYQQFNQMRSEKTQPIVLRSQYLAVFDHFLRIYLEEECRKIAFCFGK